MTSDINLITKKFKNLTMFIKKQSPEDIYIYRDGTIITEKNRVVCLGLNRMAEFKILENTVKNDILNLPFFTDIEFNDCRQEEKIDGTIIRLFYYNNEWHKATNKKINAYDCYWENKLSFGEMFDEISKNLDYSKLDKKFSHSFVIQHPSNRIIKTIEKTELYYLHSIDKNGNIEYQNLNIKSSKTYNYETIDEILDILKSKTLSWDFPGYVITHPTKNIILILENPNYSYVKELKNYMPFNTKYWKIKDNVDQTLCRLVKIILNETDTEYIKYYPEHSELIEKIKKQIDKHINEICILYWNAHITKIQRYEKTNKYYTILLTLHNNYLATKMKINKETIKKIYYNKISITKILSLLEFIEEKK